MGPTAVSTARRPPDPSSALYRRAIAGHWARQGLTAAIETQADGTQRSTWEIEAPPLVSVIIPNKNKPDLLRVCLDGLLRGTDYPRIEIIIVDNLSTDPGLEALYRDLEAKGQARIVHFKRTLQLFRRLQRRRRGRGGRSVAVPQQ